LIYNEKEHQFINNIYDYKINNIKPLIPLKVYSHWHTKDLPPIMKQKREKLIRDNPEFEFELYDNDDCRKFIEANFDKDVLYAFDSLIPGAYKADLWRYCIIYKYGGIYLDICRGYSETFLKKKYI
jgi:mannosyltransferase OCH1-like enzyme